MEWLFYLRVSRLLNQLVSKFQKMICLNGQSFLNVVLIGDWHKENARCNPPKSHCSAHLFRNLFA